MRLKLAADERVIVKTRAHRRVLARPAVLFLVLVAATSFLLGYLTREQLPEGILQAAPLLRPVAAVASAVLLLSWCVGPLVRWLGTWTILTTRRVVVRRGIGARAHWELPLVLVRALHVDQSLMQRGSGAGNLVLETGAGRSVLPNVPSVHRLRELMLDAVEALPRTAMVDGVEIDGEQRMDWTGHD